MPFEVRQDDSPTARDTALEIFNATREVPCDARRFEWLYLHNPDGPAVLWTVRDTAMDAIAGFTVALPRRMIVDGRERLCWNCADFSILPKYRSLGVALKLRRAAKEGVDDAQVDFLYAHPNARMAPIHNKVGHRSVGRMVRYATLLRSASFFEKKVGNRLIAAAMGGMVDPLLRVAEHKPRASVDFETYVESVPRFNERFDDLFERSQQCVRVLGVRDARYLTWRYADNPLQETHAVLAQAGGILRGYLLFAIEDDVAFIKDVFPPNDVAVAQALVAAFIREARQRRLGSLSVTLLEGGPLAPVLADFGFRQRADSSEMMVYAPPESDLSTVIADAGHWFATVGDRDV